MLRVIQKSIQSNQKLQQRIICCAKHTPYIYKMSSLLYTFIPCTHTITPRAHTHTDTCFGTFYCWGKTSSIETNFWRMCFVNSIQSANHRDMGKVKV